MSIFRIFSIAASLLTALVTTNLLIWEWAVPGPTVPSGVIPAVILLLGVSMVGFIASVVRDSLGARQAADCARYAHEIREVRNEVRQLRLDLGMSTSTVPQSTNVRNLRSWKE